jgi:hypothetical protein
MVLEIYFMKIIFGIETADFKFVELTVLLK